MIEKKELEKILKDCIEAAYMSGLTSGALMQHRSEKTTVKKLTADMEKDVSLIMEVLKKRIFV